MKKRFSILFLFLFILSLGYGCSSIQRKPEETLYFQKKIGIHAPTKVMILPFSSYVIFDSPRKWLQLNAYIYDSIAREFEKYGIDTISFDTVLNQFEQEHIISYGFQRLLNKNQLRPYETQIFLNEIRRIQSTDPHKIYRIAQRLGADYVIRGQILALEINKNYPINPIRAGFLTAAVRSMKRILYGEKAVSAEYDKIQNASTGAYTGMVLGMHAADPFSAPAEYDFFNPTVWAATGALAAFIADRGATDHQIFYAERIYIYSIPDKMLLWSGSAEIKSEPDTFFNQDYIPELLRKAIYKTSQNLLTRFWKDYYAYKEIPIATATTQIKTKKNKKCENENCLKENWPSKLP